MDVLSTGCQWRAVPSYLPPRSTLYDYFDRWSWEGTLDRIHDALYVKCREAAAREASPTAAIIDSQSVESAGKGAYIDPPGYRCRQEDQGQEAARACRYARPADARDRAFRRRPRPRRRGVADGEPVWRLPVPDQALRRRWLPRPEFHSASKRLLAPSSSRSSSDSVTPHASPSCPSAGSSNAPSPGLAAAADWPRIGSAQPQGPRLPAPRLNSASCCESYAIPHDVSGQLSASGQSRSPRAGKGLPRFEGALSRLLMLATCRCQKINKFAIAGCNERLY